MAKLFFSLPMAAFFLALALALASLVIHANLDGKKIDQGAATYHPNGGEGSVRIQDCPRACRYRCSATSHRKPCLFFCNKCCQKCLCVPSGTYGRREECPCYNNWRTKEGGYKCP